MRTWGIVDTAQMVQRTAQSIRDLEKSGKIPSPEKNDKNRRVYTLEHINRLREHFSTLPQKPDDKEPCIIAVTNFKGGVWKTTEAIDIAHHMALKGYRTLFIDCDSQASATQTFGYIPDTDIDVAETLMPILCGEDGADIKKQIRKTYWPNLDLIPANLLLYDAEFRLPIQHARAAANNEPFNIFDKLHKHLKNTYDQYDFVIIDCPPSMGMISINACYAANALVIPSPPSMLDFSSTVQFFAMLKGVLKSIPDKEYDFIRLLITKYEKSDSAQFHTSLINQLYGDYVFLTRMPVSEAVKRATTEMRSIYEIDSYAGSKKTLDRIRMAMDEMGSEIEALAQKNWVLGGENDKG